MKKVFLMLLTSILLLTSTVAAQECKIYSSKTGAVVLVSGEKKFVADVEDVIKTSNECNKIIGSVLVDKTSSPPNTREYLIIDQVGKTMIIRPSNGEILYLPSKDVKNPCRWFYPTGDIIKVSP